MCSSDERHNDTADLITINDVRNDLLTFLGVHAMGCDTLAVPVVRHFYLAFLKCDSLSPLKTPNCTLDMDDVPPRIDRPLDPEVVYPLEYRYVLQCFIPKKPQSIAAPTVGFDAAFKRETDLQGHLFFCLHIYMELLPFLTRVATGTSHLLLGPTFLDPLRL